MYLYKLICCTGEIVKTHTIFARTHKHTHTQAQSPVTESKPTANSAIHRNRETRIEQQQQQIKCSKTYTLWVFTDSLQSSSCDYICPLPVLFVVHSEHQIYSIVSFSWIDFFLYFFLFADKKNEQVTETSAEQPLQHSEVKKMSDRVAMTHKYFDESCVVCSICVLVWRLA